MQKVVEKISYKMLNGKMNNRINVNLVLTLVKLPPADIVFIVYNKTWQ